MGGFIGIGNQFYAILLIIFIRYLVLASAAFLVFSQSKVGKWINTSVNHNQHHEYFTGNYGLYFLWWDRWMGTLRQDYDQRFDEVKARKS